MSVRLIDKYAAEFIEPGKLAAVRSRLAAADACLMEHPGGNDFKGWYELPETYDRDEVARIEAAAAKIRANSEACIIVGVGGSYLGARAAVEFLHSQYYNLLKKDTPDIYFVGNSFSSDDLFDVLKICEGKELSINVISKSGTTTESAVAFRFVRDLMMKKYGAAELRERIYVTTDKKKGALKKFADSEGYPTFVVPDDVGGRFSVLTAVGLLPIAISGADIRAILAGALDMKKRLSVQGMGNDAYRYAAFRNLFYEQGRTVEILGSFEPSFRMMTEWWKQLFGESEGKNGKGIFPASVTLTTDLHSIGQYIQDGRRMLFETVVKQKQTRHEMIVPSMAADIDGLGFLAGERLGDVNDRAYLGTLLAHTAGGVPNIVVEYDRRDEHDFGELVYFFFVACAMSAYMLGVNPFDQPGVEAYKKNMFALIGKPGYEKQKKELMDKIDSLYNE